MTDTGEWFLWVCDDRAPTQLPLVISDTGRQEWARGEWRVVDLQLMDPHTGYHSTLGSVELHESYDPGDGVFYLDALDPDGYLMRVVRLMIRRAR
jgi:hypothetical protein